MALVFYISGHGFGHASRDVEVINALAPDPREPVVVRTAVSPELLRRTLRVPYSLIPGPCDTGIIQASSVSHDDPATVRAVITFYEDFAEKIEAELRALRQVDTSMIVGDIPPLAFAVASRLGVRSIALGNFTWDWIYETHPGFLPVAAGALDIIRDAYRGATLGLELPFSGGFAIFRNREQLPLVARRATQSTEATREFFGLPPNGRVALLSFGGYGLPSLDLATLDCRDDWMVVTTDRVSGDAAAPPPNVRVVVEQEFLTSEFRYEDLVAAADVVVTKPGYGIIAECISTGTAMLYTSRGAFREYEVLVEALPHFVRSRFISQEDLFAGRWKAALEGLMCQPSPAGRMPVNGAEAAAERIRLQLCAR